MAISPDDLRARAAHLLPPDRRRLLHRISGALKVAEPARRRDLLALLDREIVEAERRARRRRSAAPLRLSYPEELPITDRREELLTALRRHQVIIVAGETGSGKSTQLPKMCLELGRGIERMIGHTQPRRIAARSIAERIAEETGTSIGGPVGYAMRFDDRIGDDTMVKVMTDGILLAEIHRDRSLSRYDTIILDEAHERSLNIDFLLGYLKGLLPRRRDLKLVITSATIDTERFAAHFDGAPVVEVSGRSHPVEIRYRPLDDPSAPEPRDQTEGICDAVAELVGEGPGDVLVFCAGEREIRDAVDALAELRLRHTELLPLYARLSSAEQHRVFRPHPGRRIVLATNVAETSLTVPGIRYVVDAGTARISRYSRRTKVQRLPIEPISQASAGQRAGRCGRLGPGICIRLYDEDDFSSRPAFTDPEILRTNLASVILQMAVLDLGDVSSFPFLDPPDSRAIRDGTALLHELGAVDPDHQGSRRWVTNLGHRLARLPIDLRLGRMVLEAARNDCLREVMVITAALAIQDPRERPREQEARADQLHARFRDEASDFLSWLHLWEYVRGERRERSSSQFRKMCREELLNYRRVREWQDLHGQLREVVADLGLTPNRAPADAEAIHRSILAGLLSHIGRRDPDGFEYRGARGTRFSISPGSTLFKAAPGWVMAAELVETTRLWAREAAPIEAAWVEKLAGHLVTRSHGDPWWDPRRGSAMATETVTLFGIPLVADRVVPYGRVLPDVARELFIRHALVSGEWETHHRFAERNRERIEEMLALEARERRGGLLAGDDDLVAFFDRRLPPDITTARAFDRWWNSVRDRDAGLLDLTREDLLAPGSRLPDEELFPPVWRHGDLAMPLEYEFDPDSASDGITVEIPVSGLDRLDPSVFAWQVPGRRAELFEALLRTLPKAIRRKLVPIPETAAALAGALQPGPVPLLEALRRELSRRTGDTVLPGDLNIDAVPGHLRPRFRVIGDDGEVIAEGDDLGRMRTGLVEEARRAQPRHALERTGLVSWDLGELPRVVDIGREGRRTPAFPALVDDGDSVAIRLLATPDEQGAEMRAGTARLLLLGLVSPVKLLRPLLTGAAEIVLSSGPYPSPSAWCDDCLRCAVDRLVEEAGGPAWDAVGFDGLRSYVRDELGDMVTAVGEESLALLDTRRIVLTVLDRLPERLAATRSDVRSQLDRLVHPGFLTMVGAARVPDVHRYVRAAEVRLDRLTADPARDASLMARIKALEAEYDSLAGELPPTPELLEIAWMLEELRVSFFAQALGTRAKVSETRIRRALGSVAGVA